MNEYNVYDFEAMSPPRIVERELREKARARRLRRAVYILMLGTVLSSFAALSAAIALMPYSIMISVFFFILSAYILVGSGVVAVMFLCRGVKLIAEQ